MNPTGEGSNQPPTITTAPVADVSSGSPVEPVNPLANLEKVVAKAKIITAGTAIPSESEVNKFVAQFGEPGINNNPTPAAESTILPETKGPTDPALDVATPNPVTVDDLLTNGPRAAPDLPVVPADEVVPPQVIDAPKEEAASQPEPVVEKTPKEKFMEQIAKIVDEYTVAEPTDKVTV